MVGFTVIYHGTICKTITFPKNPDPSKVPSLFEDPQNTPAKDSFIHPSSGGSNGWFLGFKYIQGFSQ